MNPQPTRRDFLKRAALFSLVAGGLSAGRVVAAIAPIQRVGGACLKPALNAFSFLELLTAHTKDAGTGIDLFAVCDFCAQHDLEAVDLTGYFFPDYPKVPADSYIYRLKRHAHDLGLGISGTGVRNDFTTADKAVRAAGVQVIKEWIEVAAKLGAPAIRVFADSQAPFKNWRDASGNASREAVEAWMSTALHECAEYGEKFGVIVAVQNHGDFISTGAEHLNLLKQTDHAWCAALVDTGKYMTPNPYADIALMAPYAVNWQIKENLFSQADAPRTDFKKLVTIIRQSGYRGYLPIETLAMGRKNYDPFTEVLKVLVELRVAIAATTSVVPINS
jgi:sugar phosphate isomerase/epimerase